MRDCDINAMLVERESVLIREYDAALDMAGFDSRDIVLDIATGSGRMLQQLLNRGYTVISGDIDKEALDRAKERLGDLGNKPKFMLFDAHSLPFDDNSINAITLANAIHEIKDPCGVLDEIVRVLSDDGKLLVVEFNSLGFEMMELHHKMQGRGKHPEGEMAAEDIENYLRKSFKSVKTSEFSITHAWVAFGKGGGKQ